MFKYIFEGVGNINWMVIVFLLIFMVVFFVSVMMVFCSKFVFIDKMVNMLFDDFILFFNVEND